jgi:hypothetical protein
MATAQKLTAGLAVMQLWPSLTHLHCDGLLEHASVTHMHLTNPCTAHALLWQLPHCMQARALVVHEQQQQDGAAAASLQQLDCGRSMLPLPGLPGSSMMTPQPLLEVAAAEEAEL